MPQFDLDCPIDKGNISVHTEIGLPPDIPRDTYWVVVNALTAGFEKILCIKTILSF